MSEDTKGAAQKAPGNGKKVLLVDDDKFLIDLYTLKFTQAGFTVQSALSSKEALDALRGGFIPDVVLFDIIMPEGDGFYLLETIRSEKLAPSARFIALTNEMNADEEKRIRELGASRYIVKATLIPSEVVENVSADAEKEK